jgi:hypothetical protein
MTDYPRCRTCKHWKPPPAPDRQDGECVLGLGFWGNPTVPTTLAWASSWGNDDNAFLLCEADFGCIQHEETDDGATQG